MYKNNQTISLFFILCFVLGALVFSASSAQAWELKKHPLYKDSHILPFCSLENRVDDLGVTLFLAKSVNESEKMLLGFRRSLLQENKNYRVTLSFEKKAQRPHIVKAELSAIDQDLLELSLSDIGLTIKSLAGYERLNIIGFGDLVQVDLNQEILGQGLSDLKSCLTSLQTEYLAHREEIEKKVKKRQEKLEESRKYVTAGQQVLDFANVPYREIEDLRFEDALLRRAGVITWRSKYLLGAVRALKFSQEESFRAAAQTYLNNFKNVCVNGFVNDVSPNEKQGSLEFIRADIACARETGDHLMSVLFVKKDKKALVFLQEGEMKQATEVIAVRNDVLQALQKIADTRP